MVSKEAVIGHFFQWLESECTFSKFVPRLLEIFCMMVSATQGHSMLIQAQSYIVTTSDILVLRLDIGDHIDARFACILIAE